MTPLETYLALEQQLLNMRNQPEETQEENALLDKMDSAWYNMSQEEIQQLQIKSQRKFT